MSKFLVLFAYNDGAAAKMLDHPSDRALAVGKLCEAAGGRLESFHWMLGPYDGALITEMPDGQTMTSIALAVTGTHLIKTFETYQLIPHEDITAVEERARELTKSYAPPGQEA